MDILNLLGALLTIGFGLFGLLFPAKIARLVGLTAKTKAGSSEFRATYGGVWLAMGIALLAIDQPVAYTIVGIAWLGAALGRLFSIIIDKSSTQQNWTAFVIEIIGAGLLLAGSF